MQVEKAIDQLRRMPVRFEEKLKTFGRELTDKLVNSKNVVNAGVLILWMPRQYWSTV